MLLFAIVLKGMAELVLLVLFGQGVLYVLAGAQRHQNLIYRMFTTITAPIMKAARFITPRFVVDAHIGLVAFFLVAVVWVLALALKVQAVLGAAAPPA